MIKNVRPEISKMMHERKYYHEGEYSWGDLSRRVAKALASVESDKKEYWEEKFYELIGSMDFIPSSPVLMNADTDRPFGLSSCFVIDIKDDMWDISMAEAKAAKIYQYNGGVGFNISALRPASASLLTAKGNAGGPVAALEKFDVNARYATLHNSRKSATKIDLDVTHPDIYEFIHCKDDGKSLSMMNISVGITDEFMKAVKEDADWELAFPNYKDNKAIYDEIWDGDLADWKAKGYPVVVYRTVKARELFREICNSAWKRGDPGISFVDKLNKKNPNKHKGKVRATNPCFRGDMKLLTADGYKTFEELDGKEVDIVNKDSQISHGKVWCSGEKEVIELTLSNRKKIVCTPDHVFMVINQTIDTSAWNIGVTPDNHIVIMGPEVPNDSAYEEVKAKDLLGKVVVCKGCATASMGDCVVVTSIQPAGKAKVYDFTEPLTHWGIVEGVIVHNCAEFNSIPYSSCCLGSHNIASYVTVVDGVAMFNWERLRDNVKTSVRLLDNVIDANVYPLDIIRDVTKANRSIGIGIMGFADALYALHIRYGSRESIEFLGDLMEYIQVAAESESRAIAEEKGVYPNWKGSSWYESGMKIRNSDLTSIAPTGSISFIADVSSGIEPLFALAYTRETNEGDKYYIVNNTFKETLQEKGIYSDALIEKISNNHGSCSGIEEIPKSIQNLFVTTYDVTPNQHINMASAAQKHISLSISKTVNLSNDTEIEEVEKIYEHAFDAGILGITIYRDGSREDQVLSTGSTSPSKEPEEIAEQMVMEEVKALPEVIFDQIHPVKRKDLGEVLSGTTDQLKVACGKLYLTVNKDHNGHIVESFVHTSKNGICPGWSDGTNRLISLALRSGIAVDEITDALQGITCKACKGKQGLSGLSCPDALARVIDREYKKTPKDVVIGGAIHALPGEISNAVMEKQQEYIAPLAHPVGILSPDATFTYKAMDLQRLCPECGSIITNDGGCVTCRSCGWTKCG